MPALAAANAAPDAVQTVADFARDFSIEVTHPSAADIDALRAAAPAGTAVYLSALPARPAEELIAAAVSLRAAGFEPVPHLAARNFASRAALDGYLARLTGEAGVRRLLLIAGDHAQPRGPFHSAADAIDSGLISRHGIGELGIAGYPDGHPRIPDYELDRVLAAKIEAAAQMGIALTIVTQFCFEAAAVIAWLDRIRASGIDLPVRIGLAGPTSLTTLMRYARRCGVKASARALARNAGLTKHLLGAAAPDALVRALAEAVPTHRLGDVAPHYFSFGGIAATAQWAASVAAGRIVLDRAGGFGVERGT
jgi:methylenetetrahydrofolate reductase (NADH)